MRFGGYWSTVSIFLREPLLAPRCGVAGRGLAWCPWEGVPGCEWRWLATPQTRLTGGIGRYVPQALLSWSQLEGSVISTAPSGRLGLDFVREGLTLGAGAPRWGREVVRQDALMRVLLGRFLSNLWGMPPAILIARNLQLRLTLEDLAFLYLQYHRIFARMPASLYTVGQIQNYA
jgi:hypothetical protein